MPAHIVDAGHPASFAQAMLPAFALMQTSRPPATHCWTQTPDPHEPQAAPSVAQLVVGTVVLVVDVGPEVVLVERVVVVWQSMSS